MSKKISLVLSILTFLNFSYSQNEDEIKTKLKAGDKAPLFKGILWNEEHFDLKDFVGKINIVLYFYPKDDTPGCRIEACSFSDNFEKIKDLNFKILGVSVDDPESHRKFIDKYDLKFDLISDVDHKIIEKYGVKRSVSDKVYARRVTFLVDKEGIIRYIWDPVKVDGHTEEVIAKIRELKLN